LTVAVILAGGLGSRLRSVVSDVPKPMAPIAGRPFLEWLMDYWIDQGIQKFIISVGYLHEAISSHFGNTYHGAEIEYAIETAPLGTGGGLLMSLAKGDLKDPFFLINGDTLFNVSAEKIIKHQATYNSGVVFSVFRASEDDRFGAVDINETGKDTLLSSLKAKTGQFANGGVYLIDPIAIKKQFGEAVFSCSFEDEILPSLVNAGIKFSSVISPGNFIDIGIPEDFLRAHEAIPKAVGIF